MFVDRVSPTMAYTFFKYLLPYLKAALPLPEAIQCVGTQLPMFSRLSKKLHPLILQGYRLSLVLEILGAPISLREWIQTGESTGQLVEAIESALALHQAKKALQKTWIGLLRYPLFILLFMVVSIFILHSAVFPSLIKFYGDRSIPFLTRLIFNHPLVSAGVLMLLPALISFLFLPFKRLQHHLNLCEALSLKLKAGIPLSQAAPKNWQMLLSHGYRLSIVLKIQKADPFLIHLVSTGEATGNLQESFLQAKKFYQEKSLLYVERLQAYLPSALMILMAGFVGMLVISIYLPLLNLSF